MKFNTLGELLVLVVLLALLLPCETSAQGSILKKYRCKGDDGRCAYVNRALQTAARQAKNCDSFHNASRAEQRTCDRAPNSSTCRSRKRATDSYAEDIVDFTRRDCEANRKISNGEGCSGRICLNNPEKACIGRESEKYCGKIESSGNIIKDAASACRQIYKRLSDLKMEKDNCDPEDPCLDAAKRDILRSSKGGGGVCRIPSPAPKKTPTALPSPIPTPVPSKTPMVCPSSTSPC